MKHRKTGRQFGRVRSQRKALMRTMLGSLIMYGRIETTEAKAKELQAKIDRLITRVLRTKDSSHAKMEALRKIENDVPTVAAKVLRDEVVPRCGTRVSGFTRVIKLVPRKSDGARRAIIEFVDQPKDTPAKKTKSSDTKGEKSKEVETEKKD